MSGKLAILVLVGILLTGCASDPPYFGDADEVTVTLASEPGITVYVGVADLRADDPRVTLLDLRPTAGGDLDQVGQWVLRRSETGGGGIGIVAEPDLPADVSPGLAGHPLPGYVLTPADGSVQVVLGMRPPSAGVFRAGPVTLSFRVDGGPTRQQSFPTTIRLCVARPAPTDCGPEAQ